MGKKAKIKKGKKPKKNKPTSKKYKKYKIDGDKISRTHQNCPRCGPGVFLMNSQGRKYCGRCHYSEFEGKAKPEEKKEDSASKKE